MHKIDFTYAPLSGLQYGGAAGRKLGIIYNNAFWLLKFPDSLRERDLKNVEVSYGNNPMSEFLGSKIYGLAGVPVHNTVLGTYQGKDVVACEDFAAPYLRLVEFREFKVSYQTAYKNCDGNETNGTSMEIDEAFDCLYNHPILSKVPGVVERFWDMFVVDAVNGNPDRNNGNWGCLLDPITMEYTLAPVYDNGSCLYFRASRRQIEEVLSDSAKLNQWAINGIISRFVRDSHKINPFNFIRDNIERVPLLRSSVSNVVARLSVEGITALLDKTCEDELYREFYLALYKIRLRWLAGLIKSDGFGNSVVPFHLQ